MCILNGREKVTVGFAIATTVTCIAGAIPLISTSVAGIGAVPPLYSATVLIAASPVLGPIAVLCLIASAGAKAPCPGVDGCKWIFLFFLGFAVLAIGPCLIAGTYMVPQEALAQTISGQIIMQHWEYGASELAFWQVHCSDIVIALGGAVLTTILGYAAYSITNQPERT
ncbi:MAG: hypothetical protein JSS50_04320 [Proteobacteria bacterium]|nr:hypothetical protein [Pseudomonadota bacterium]